MDEITQLINKADNLKGQQKLDEAIKTLREAHEIAVKSEAATTLVDIHNKLMLLFFLINDKKRFEQSHKFARTLALKIKYNRGLVETFMNKAWIATENKNFIEAIMEASHALEFDEILSNSPAFTTALYIISEANYSVGHKEKGDKYKQLYQKKLFELSDSEENKLDKIKRLSSGITKENMLERVASAMDELDTI